MKTVCFLVKFELPDSARPNSDLDVLCGSLGFILEQKTQILFSGLRTARVTAYHVPCVFNQPGALCQRTPGEMAIAAAEGGL